MARLPSPSGTILLSDCSPHPAFAPTSRKPKRNAGGSSPSPTLGPDPQPQGPSRHPGQPLPGVGFSGLAGPGEPFSAGAVLIDPVTADRRRSMAVNSSST